MQSRALEAFTTLISVDPPVSPIARNRLLESVIHLFAAPTEPTRVITPLLSSLVTLLITMLRAAARDPSAQAELLELQLSQLDRFVTSADDVIRERACGAVLALLQEYRALLSAGSSRIEGAEGSGTGECPQEQGVACLSISNVSSNGVLHWPSNRLSAVLLKMSLHSIKSKCELCWVKNL